MKNNKGLVIITIILGVLVVLMGGYIVYDKVLNQNNNSESKENKESKRGLLENISPLYYVSSSCAPTLIVQGDEDLIVNCENSYFLADKLKETAARMKLV